MQGGLAVLAALCTRQCTGGAAGRLARCPVMHLPACRRAKAAWEAYYAEMLEVMKEVIWGLGVPDDR